MQLNQNLNFKVSSNIYEFSTIKQFIYFRNLSKAELKTLKKKCDYVLSIFLIATSTIFEEPCIINSLKVDDRYKNNTVYN